MSVALVWLVRRRRRLSFRDTLIFLMVNFLSSILTVQPLLVTAQHVGRYVYETEDFRMIFDINDDHEANFIFKAHPRSGVTPKGSTSFSTGMVPLGNLFDSDYLFALGKRGPGYADHTDLYNAIGHSLGNAGVVKPDGSFPPAGIQYGDLTFLTYPDSDHISTYFQGEEVIFRKAGILIPGTFVYNEPSSPSLKVVFKVRSDGIVRIKVKCGRRSTPRFRCKLTSGIREEVFVVGSARKGTSCSGMLEKAKSVCRKRSLAPGDLSEVVFANDKTIYTEIEGTRKALTNART